MQNSTPMTGPVAIVGAGPAGLATARWLKQHGLQPHIFEASGGLGGQWNARGSTSATWAGMRTNTSRTLSRFSDRAHDGDVPVFPTREDMLGYLYGYAGQFDLHRHVRLGTRVERIAREGAGWRIGWRSRDGAGRDNFSGVVIASGAEGTPIIPRIPGIGRFTGPLGAQHSAQYAGVDRFRGHHVLIVGGSISALEIASDLALGGAASVTVATRRQRYVLPKLIAGVPADHVLFTRMAALSEQAMPAEAMAAMMKQQVLKAGGDPAHYGAPPPHPDLFVAGITQAQHFLPCVAEGRIAVRPGGSHIDGRAVQFADGARIEPDAIIFATGYAPSLGYFADREAETLQLADGAPDLHAHSFHPDLPGLAFVGLYNLVGPKFPVIELQARWIAALWAGRQAMPARADMVEGVAAARARRIGGQQPVMHAMAIDFARRHGVDPDPLGWPSLTRALLFGPLSPTAFRLEGPDRIIGAAQAFAAEAALFGGAPVSALADAERAACDAVGLPVCSTRDLQPFQ